MQKETREGIDFRAIPLKSLDRAIPIGKDLELLSVLFKFKNSTKFIKISFDSNSFLEELRGLLPFSAATATTRTLFY